MIRKQKSAQRVLANPIYSSESEHTTVIHTADSTTELPWAGHSVACGVEDTAAPPVVSQSAAEPTALIDWGQAAPDGTAATATRLLKQLATRLHCEVHLAVMPADTSHGTKPEIFHSSDSHPSKLPEPRLIEAALIEASRASASCLFATTQGYSSGVLKNLLDNHEDAVWLSFAVEAPDASNPAGRSSIVLRVPRSQVQSKEFYAAQMERIRRELPAWLVSWRLCALGLCVQRWQQLGAKLISRRTQMIVAICLAAVACLAVPVPYRPQRPCVAEPAARAYVSSPIEGQLTSAAVRPGDVVRRGQELARIDDQQIQWELSAAEADYEAATKRRDAALAARAGGELRLAQLEQERIELTIQSLRRQLEQTAVHSPIDGVVVQGDWYQNDGAPVTRGETLFEIAPLEAMQIQTHLTTADLGRLRVGSRLSVYFDAAPGQSWSGEIQRLDPRAQVIDSQVVFIAETEVDNVGQVLKPGMKGNVRLDGGRRSIGWLLFHRPYLWIMKKLVW